MDEKITSTLDKICRLASQNSDFRNELRKRLNFTSTNSILLNDDRISHIYEYCIEEVVKKQAKDFYKDIPLPNIVHNLEEDFVKMEFFHRKNNFGDFCLSLYQQIECITNKLCEDSDLYDITSKMWGSPAYVKITKDVPVNIANRIESDYCVANLVFPGVNRKTGMSYYIEKSKLALQSQTARDKMRIIVYFVGYRAMMKGNDYDSYVELTSLLDDIYQCRNMNHRGNTLYPWEEERLNRILSMQSYYYFKFMGALAQYVDFIRTGLPYIPQIKSFSDSIEIKKVPAQQLKILGKIDLPDDGKSRIKE